MNCADSNEDKLLDVLKARALLMISGVFGFHRLYLRQPPEAFIFFSTWGVFLLGVFLDSFFINGYVAKYNAHFENGGEPQKKNKKKMYAKLQRNNDAPDNHGENADKKKNGNRLLPSVSQHVPFSFTRCVYSILYGLYIGFLVWLTGSISFGLNATDHFALLIAIAAAISFGVFIVGNCGDESRSMIYIWIGAFVTLLIAMRVCHISPVRSMLLAAIAATLLGNRSSKPRSARDQPYTYRHYVFWCSLFMLVVCVLTAGVCRNLLERRISVYRSEARLTSSLAKLLYDRYSNPIAVYRFFGDDPQQLTFENPNAKGNPNAADSSDDAWYHWLDVDTWVLGHGSPPWTDNAAVFAVDLMRAEARAQRGKLVEEPLKWAAWRAYAIWAFNMPATATDQQLERACAQWLRANSKKKTDAYANRSKTRACEVARL